MDDINGRIANLIKRKRLEAGLSQKKVALKCGWTQQNQSLIEGRQNKITVEQVWIIAQALKINLMELIPADFNNRVA